MTTNIDVEIKSKEAFDIGIWLEQNMPNRPLPDAQRWAMGYDTTGSRLGIRFINEKDAVMFMLRWP